MNEINESDYTYEIGDIVRIVEFAGFYYPDNIPDYYDRWMVVKDSRNLDYDGDYPGPQLIPVVFDENLHMYKVPDDYDGGLSIEQPHDYSKEPDIETMKIGMSGAKCVPACFLEKTGDRVVLLADSALPGVKRCYVPKGVITIVYTKVDKKNGKMRLVGTSYSPEFAEYIAMMFMNRLAENGKGESGEGGEDT